MDPKLTGHEPHRDALAQISHLVVSPMGLAELDYLISSRGGARKALAAARFIERNQALRRFEVPPPAAHLSTAIAVAEGYADADADADRGKGIGLADAMNAALAAAYSTDVNVHHRPTLPHDPASHRPSGVSAPARRPAMEPGRGRVDILPGRMPGKARLHPADRPTAAGGFMLLAHPGAPVSPARHGHLRSALVRRQPGILRPGCCGPCSCRGRGPGRRLRNVQVDMARGSGPS
ncbi:PIN domain-containing protein [Streptomyces sp. NPDC005522]